MSLCLCAIRSISVLSLRLQVSGRISPPSGPGMKALEKNKERLTAREIVHDENTAKLSIVGAGMATNPGVAAMFFEAMYDAGVNIQMISTSEIKITVLIAKDDVDAAMVAVHDKFKMASVNMRKAADTEE